MLPVRGNKQASINKIVKVTHDGLMVAKAALNRLKIHYPNMHIFSENQMLPAAAQGAIGIEVYVSQIQSGILEMLNMINCQKTFTATKIERDIVAALEGSCLSPIRCKGASVKSPSDSLGIISHTDEGSADSIRLITWLV